MQIELPLRFGLVILAIAATVVTGGSIVFADGDAPAASEQMDSSLITLDDGSVIWPYTSQSTSPSDRTLGLNLLIYGETTETRYILQHRHFRDWEEVDEEREDIAAAEDFEVDLNQTALGWGQAHGADRWIWVDPAGGDPVWMGESYQLAQGDYLGQRDHIRAYEDPHNGEWTALQAHTEHWDWFHLRHTVHSVEDSQLAVEDEFVDQWYIGELHRARWANDIGSDADGWVTVIELEDQILPTIIAIMFLGIGAVTTVGVREWVRELTVNPAVTTGIRALSLILAIVFAYHAVRTGAIGLERTVSGYNPKLIVAGFYPLLVIGIPIMTYLLSRPLDATTAFWAATLGFVVATFVDYTYLGVLRIPLETFVHRGALALAIGMIAAGASQTARKPVRRTGYVRTGVILWLVAVSLPYLQFL